MRLALKYDKQKKELFANIDEFYFTDNVIFLARSVKIAKKILKDNNCEELLTNKLPKAPVKRYTPLGAF